LPLEAAELLRQGGYDAVTVLGQDLGGSADPDIIAVCQQEQRALITLDKDFCDIRVYPPSEHSGLIVLRIPQAVSIGKRITFTFAITHTGD